MSNNAWRGEPGTGKNFAYYETIAGGMGGRFGRTA
jgi:N-methylhydantoinase B/oxoprolinase/acetone carboxylase alpha subunit